MNKCDFCTMAKNKNGKLVCSCKEGKEYTFCSEAIEKMEKVLARWSVR